MRRESNLLFLMCRGPFYHRKRAIDFNPTQRIHLSKQTNTTHPPRGFPRPSTRPHTLPPERLYLAHLAPYLTETEKQLQVELKQTQSENEALALELQRQREEVEELMAGLERIVGDVEMANVTMGEAIEGGEEDLGREAREMEEEVRGVGRGARL